MGRPKQAGADSQLSLLRALAFAAIGLPIHAVTLAATVYLPNHYATQLGIDLALVGSAFFLVRAIDIPVELLIGGAIDRTRTRWGRFRPWMLLGLPVFMLGAWFAFNLPPGAGRTQIVVWMLVLYLGHSTLTLAQLAWGSTLAPGYDERSRLFGIVAAMGILGGASIIAVPIITGSGGKEAAIVPLMGWIVLVGAPLTLMLLLASTPEPAGAAKPAERPRYRDIVAMLAQPTFRRLFAADIAVSLGVGWVGAIYLFFFTDARGFTTAQASVLLAVYILSGIAGAPAMGWLATRTSKHRTLVTACIVYAIATSALLFLPRGALLIHVPFLIAAGFVAASFTSTARAMTADIADEIRLELGQDRTGLLYALTTMTNKITAAISVGLTYYLLSQVGYVARKGAVNSDIAIRGLELVYLAGPVLFVGLGALCMIGYDLDARRHADIRSRLAERDALDATALVTGETDPAALKGPA